MDHFTIPCAMRIDTKGVLDIPADAEVVVNDNGEYAGFVTADGDVFAHRTAPDELMAYIAAQNEPAPAATPAAQAHADELGVDLSQVEGTGQDGTILKSDVAAAAATGPTAEALTDGTPTEETADSGQADSQQAG